jgi:hypothetical protein
MEKKRRGGRNARVTLKMIKRGTGRERIQKQDGK